MGSKPLIVYTRRFVGTQNVCRVIQWIKSSDKQETY